MSKKIRLPKHIERSIAEMVAHYIENKPSFQSIAESLASDVVKDPKLGPFVHSIKFRIKDPRSLEKKLRKKALDAQKKKKPFAITKENLFTKITDLAGVRVLHLYPKQMSEMKPLIEELLSNLKFRTIERIAYTWDEEYKQLFKSLGYKTKFKPSMYTSLHHVIVANRKNNFRCEMQVRTLMEEVWGEVDHTINYPKPSESVACREQLKALARMSSAGTRLVDSIFESHDEHSLSKKKPLPARKR